MTLTCKCGATNRIPSLPTARVRCGACKHEFQPSELVKAKPEAPEDFTLARERDLNLDDDDPLLEDWEGD